jgi:hypothetical protein
VVISIGLAAFTFGVESGEHRVGGCGIPPLLPPLTDALGVAAPVLTFENGPVDAGQSGFLDGEVVSVQEKAAGPHHRGELGIHRM